MVTVATQWLPSDWPTAAFMFMFASVSGAGYNDAIAVVMEISPKTSFSGLYEHINIYK